MVALAAKKAAGETTHGLGSKRVSSVLRRRRFTRQPLGPQPFLVGVKRLLRCFMVAHGLLGLDPARRIARLALFRGQGFASEGKVFSHAK